MGWKPVRVTYTSDYFQVLYELAVKLIKNDKAYVCHQTKADIEASREIARAKTADPNAPGDPNSPWRNRCEQVTACLLTDVIMKLTYLNL